MIASALLPLLAEALRVDFDPQAPRAALLLFTALAPHAAFASSPSAASPGAAAAAAAAALPLHAPRAAADDLLPLWGYAELLQSHLLPTLLRALEAWAPTTDPVPLQDWALPWGAHHLLGGPAREEDGVGTGGAVALGGAAPIQALWTPLRNVVQEALEGWHPSDISAAQLLAPWSPPVWEVGEWEGLLRRCITPKLSALLREVFAVAGSGEGSSKGKGHSFSSPLTWLAPWAPLLPPVLASQLLETELPLLWLTSLASQMGLLLLPPFPDVEGGSRAAPRVDFVAAAADYEAVKSVLEGVLGDAAAGLRRGAFARLRWRALALMEAAVQAAEGGRSWEDARGAAAELLQPLRLGGARATAAAAVAAPMQRGARGNVGGLLASSLLLPEKERPVGASSATGPTFRDVVEASAAAAGLTFVPAQHRRGGVDGCAVFKMGARALVYVNNGVLFVDEKGSGAYLPMALDEALKRAA